jgi:hypothetical protein
LARGDPGLQAAGSKKRGAQQEKEDGESPRDPLHDTGHIKENLRGDKIRSKKGKTDKRTKDLHDAGRPERRARERSAPTPEDRIPEER